jgi:2-amino-4-hydroxy-6-hydroxymethyldihydropteridine diphosphokinase
MAIAYVAIGSNLEPASNVARAIEALRREFAAVARSPVYASKPVGTTGPDFYNLVVRFQSGLEPSALVRRLRELERSLGRVRGPDRNAPRTIDLDLLLYDDLIRHDAEVNVPHPDIRRYAFVRRPLADLAADLPHPELGLGIAALHAAERTGDPDLRVVELPA